MRADIISISIHKLHPHLHPHCSLGASRQPVSQSTTKVHLSDSHQKKKKEKENKGPHPYVRGSFAVDPCQLPPSPKMEYVDHFGWRAAVDLSRALGSRLGASSSRRSRRSP